MFRCTLVETWIQFYKCVMWSSTSKHDYLNSPTKDRMQQQERKEITRWSKEEKEGENYVAKIKLYSSNCNVHKSVYEARESAIALHYGWIFISGTCWNWKFLLTCSGMFGIIIGIYVEHVSRIKLATIEMQPGYRTCTSKVRFIYTFLHIFTATMFWLGF